MNMTDSLPATLTKLLAELDERGITDHRRYSAVRNYLNFRARENDIPISGVFELTPFCNLDCKMCYVHLEKNQLSGCELLSADTWENLMSDAAKHGMTYAKLTGGECLTYPHFKEIYLFLRELGVETSILTNGVLVDEDMTAFLAANPPASIQITLYGASEDAYERVTGHRVFSRVIGNIKNIISSNLPLSVVVTPSSFMSDGEEIVRLVHSLGLPVTINSGLMSPRKETGREKSDAAPDIYIGMMKVKQELQGGAVNIWSDEEPVTAQTTDVHGEPPRGVTCGAGRSTFSISWCGEMRPCNTFPGIAEKVLEIGFSEAWERINRQAKEYPLPIECESCKYKKVCKHCVAEHASGSPSGHANPSVCEWMRKAAAAGLI
ncbi:MAG: radical SAM protein [Clostridia bacterium]|nr:radical SAM protein [Clostridia bacterium]